MNAGLKESPNDPKRKILHLMTEMINPQRKDAHLGVTSQGKMNWQGVKMLVEFLGSCDI